MRPNMVANTGVMDARLEAESAEPAEPVREAAQASEERAPAEEDNIEQFEELLRGGFSRDKVTQFFQRRPLLVARRLAEIGGVLWNVRKVWSDDSQEAHRGEALRRGLSSLGPVFVKVGQTLAQRPDIVGERVAEELKSLQVKAEPFPDHIAYAAILKDLNHTGPLAPDLCPEGCDPSLEPLFVEFSDGPVASASLGQVYKARSREGHVLAVKVQRPGVARAVALDWACLFVVTKAYRTIRQSYNDFTIVADQVASGVFLELDYHNEAQNAKEFMELHSWLGYVTAPQWVPKYSGPKGTAKVLSTEWIDGTGFEDLPKPLRRKAVRRAAEACLVQLLITGFVHADPHEGNLLYTKDGRIAFLDFGLVDRVAPKIMQGFAEGMKSIAERNWTNVALKMQDIEWTTRPVKRNLRPGLPAPSYVDCDFQEFVEALANQFEKDPDANKRLGATVAAVQSLADRYLMRTPPYIVLITRTFVTLEGFVERVDPNFNIYTMALPVALRRLVSPATVPARQAFRESVLTSDGEIRWRELEALLNSTGVVAQTATVRTSRRRRGDSDEDEDDPEADGAPEDSGIRPLEGLLATSAGSTLRRMAYDVDAGKLLRFLASPREGRPWRERATAWLADQWTSLPRFLVSKIERRQQQEDVVLTPDVVSEDSRFGRGWRKRRKRTLGFILRRQLSQLNRSGLHFLLLAILAGGYLSVRIVGGAALLVLARRMRALVAAAGGAAGGSAIFARLCRRSDAEPDRSDAARRSDEQAPGGRGRPPR